VTRLRLVKVMPFFAPATRFGGVVTQAEKVCRLLAARGHSVRVVTTDNGVGPAVSRAKWVDRDDYQVYYAQTRAWHRIPPYWSPTMAPALEEALADADVCALNVGLTMTNHLAAKIAQRNGVPYVYNAEGALCPTRLWIKRRRKRIFLKRIERPLLANAAAFQAVTHKEIGDLVGQSVVEHMNLIPNGVEPFIPGDEATFRSRFDIGKDEQLVLFLGRLHAVKGLDLLVEAFVKAALPNTRLIIAGHDEDGTGRRIESQVKAFGLDDRFVFTGHLEADARRDALTAADLFVLTSDSEGLPNAVLEALAAGVPCLLTPMCNVPEVEEALAGRVTEGSPEAVATALHELLSDPTELARMGENARTLAGDRFDLEHIVDQLEALYQSIR
jgi:glycosyltransferase involved in cell wall biosynthesis